MKRIVVIGDVHHQLAGAVDALNRLECEVGSIDQVFSVGDLCLFLLEDDWKFLSGPSKYRCPQDTRRICAAWDQWKWPLSIIGGNHEPFNRLRNWDPDFFQGKLQYVDAGVLSHSIPDLCVVGLTGIHNSNEMEFLSPAERANRKFPQAESWADMVGLAESSKISRKRLTYYKEDEIVRLKNLDVKPHLLLTHEWPSQAGPRGEHISRSPELEVLQALRPDFACCGHRHTAAQFSVNETQVYALNILSRTPHMVNAGWCVVFEWDGTSLLNPVSWPRR